MATQIVLVKQPNGLFSPFTPEDEEIAQCWNSGAVYRCEFRAIRNLKFFRKLFSLFKLAFEYWDTVEVETASHGKIKPVKCFNEYRKWLTVRAGHYEVIGYPDGSVRLRAKSLKFALMSEDEFHDVYKSIRDTIWRDIQELPFRNPEELECAVNRVMEYY